MQIKSVLIALVSAAVLTEAANIRSPMANTIAARQNRNRQGNREGNNGKKAAENKGGNNGNNGNKGQNGQNNNNNNGNGNNGGGAGAALNANLVQKGSAQDGQNPGKDGQVASKT